MTTVITDPELERRIQAERSATGADRFDEVWEGTYMMAPMPNVEHQELVSRLSAVFQEVLGWSGQAKIMAGVNVSDRKDDWKRNFRVPDVAVFLHNGDAEDLGTHWYGGPDFVVEVVSPGDQSREKLPFYSAIGVRELLLVDREPWHLGLYERTETELALAAQSDLQKNSVLQSGVLPFTFCLVQHADRPRIRVQHADGKKSWLV